MQVEYKNIDGFEGYRIGSDGTIWSNKGRGQYVDKIMEWKQIKPDIANSGNTFVTLYNGRPGKCFSVRKLVCEAFKIEIPDGKFPNHRDGNLKNNSVDNITWSDKVVKKQIVEPLLEIPNVESRDIQNFPGYKVCDDGTVWSSHIGNKWKSLSTKKLHNGKILYVALFTNKTELIRPPVYRLILESFGFKRPVDGRVFFKNFDYTDNRLENLKWITDDTEPYKHCLQFFKPEFDNVEYKEVPGYLGYIAGSNGDVWSCKSLEMNGYGEWHKLTPNLNQDGRPDLALLGSDKTPYLHIHTIVAVTFLGERPNGFEVCHNNGNKLDNNLSNLRYDTRQANCQDTAKHGSLKGSNHPKSKLTEADVLLMKQKLKMGISAMECSKIFNVSYQTVSGIRAGRSWTHVKLEENTNV